MKRYLINLLIIFSLGIILQNNAQSEELKGLCFKEHNATEVKIFRLSYYPPTAADRSFYDVCVGNGYHDVWYVIWYWRNDQFAKKSIINKTLAWSDEIPFRFKISKNTTIVKDNKGIILDIIFCRRSNTNDIFPRLRKNLCGWAFSGVGESSYQEYLKFYRHKRICFNKKLNQVRSLSDCYPENEIYYVKYDGNNFIFDPKQTSKVANKDSEKKPDNSKNDQATLDEEKRKIEEEKRKIEEEKRKIAEAKKKQEEEERKRKEANAKLYVIGSGTGFFVSAEGHIVSNDHVVGICRKVATKIEGETKYFNILKTDEVNDLGIIKGDYKSPNFLSIKADGAEYGEDIVAFGYPLADALSTSVKLTRGIVSSLSGPGNNYSEIQIDAAIQPGNSGGPILNMEGQVVGVASSGLNKLYMLEKAEYIPENVNFAVASPTLSNFLKANGVTISNQSYDIKNTKELAKIGRPSTLQLFCMNTKAVFEELKKKKKHSDVLFEKVIELR